MSQRPQSPPPLHELESEVMEEIWQRNEATVRDVLEALNRRAKDRAYTTVMTVMARLDSKGLLTRERRGKTDVYRSVLTRQGYLEARARAEVDEMVADYGDVALAHFARQLETLDSARLRQLRKLAGES